MTFQWKDRRWHVRLYLWAEPIVAEFFDKSSETDYYRDDIHTNLCPYMRTILLWLPLALAVNLLTAALVLATATIIPGKMFGWSGYGLTLLTLAVVIALIVGFVAGIESIKARRKNRPRKAVDDVIDTTPGFGTAVREWSHKVHEGICPGIIITRSGGSK